ncbi:MAG: serine/threonine-protein kinase [Rhodanobacter sp.]
MNRSATSNDLRCMTCGSARDGSLPSGHCARCLLAFVLETGSGADIGDLTGSVETRNTGAHSEQIIGRYHLLREIDRGGVGVVYHAWQADLKREVALKMLLPIRLDARDALDRFRREAELMASLDHPGILPVYEVGTHDGLPYFSMKLADGGNLAQRIPALRGQFRECARLLALIARAIGHAHVHGVLHRDLKPSNIVFDAAGQPLVTDFGLARLLAVDSSLTGIDAVIGTPRYVAPEVVTRGGQDLTAAADVYGLGAILYELLCGCAPFAELSPLQILQQVSTRRPRALRKFDAAIPPALEAICLRCLEKRPTDRYPSADALAGALETWLAGMSRGLFAGLRGPQLALPSLRRRTGTTAILLLVAGLAAAIAWRVWREPVPIPDAASAVRSVVVLPLDPRNSSPAEREAAWQLAAHLKLTSPLALLPFAPALNTATSDEFPANAGDAGAVLGAFIRVDVVALEGTTRFALRARDVLREERLYETSFTIPEAASVARQLAGVLAQRRQLPVAEGRLSRSALASLLRAGRLRDAPGENGDAAIVALKDTVARSPDVALAHALLAGAYIWRGSENLWLDFAIDEAARARRLDPSLGLAEKQLGLAYYFKGWFGRATVAYEKSHALGNLDTDYWLGLLYQQQGRFDESYPLYRTYQRFVPDDARTPALIAHLLFTVGEIPAGERSMRIALQRESKSELRTMKEAEIALYRRESARCRALAASIDPETADGFFSAAGIIRTCAVQQGDFEGALETLAATKRAYSQELAASNSNNPALREAILLDRLHRLRRPSALLKEARQGLQAAVDSNNEYPTVWLRMAAAQRVSGEIDAAYATLEHAFALGLTVNNRNRSDLEFLPFQGDARFAALRRKSEANVARQREKIAAFLPAGMREPIAREPLADVQHTAVE